MSEKYAKQMRKYMRSEITKTFNSINTSLDSYSNEEKRQCIVRLKGLQTDIKDCNQKVLAQLFDEDASDAQTEQEYNSCTEYDKKLIASLSLLESSLSNSQDHSNPCKNHLKLPELPLPEYGHREGEDLASFFTTFESIVNKYSLSSYEKFIFLQKQLRNEALTLVKSLEIGKQTFESAKELLEKAFSSPVIQQYEVLERLSKLTLSVTDDPYEYIGKMRVITESFKTLKIDTDLILQFFFWRGMNFDLQTQFVHITNKNYPTLAELDTHMFEATSRYLSISNNQKSEKKNPSKPVSSEIKAKPSTSSLATNFDYKDKSKDTKKDKGHYCSICTGKIGRAHV